MGGRGRTRRVGSVLRARRELLTRFVSPIGVAVGAASSLHGESIAAFGRP